MMAAMDTPTQTIRRHDIDALRVIVFGILILYHVGMFYVADWGWHVKSAYQSESLQLLMRLTNQWRMPLLFLVSGIAASFLFRKLEPGAFVASRTRRLLVPLLFGMVVVVVPQAYYEAVFRGAVEPGYGAFLWRYFTFQPWPEGAFAGWQYGITWMHLWYLPYLLFYTVLFVPVALWLRGSGARFHEFALRLRGAALVLLPVAPLMLYGYVLFPVFGGVSHNFITDWYAHAMYFTLFAYGYLLGAAPGIWDEIRRLRGWTLGLAFLAYLLMQSPVDLLPGVQGPVREFIDMAVLFCNRWLWILAALGWSYALLNRPFRWLPYANEAVYPWYILHQTIIVWVGFHLGQRGLGPVAEPLLVLGATIAGCAVLHEVIRRSRWLRPLFGLKPATPADHR